MYLLQYTGASCSGNDGEANRSLVATGITSAKGEIEIIVDRQVLRKTDDYTITDSTVTFSILVWNDQKIDVRYLA